LRNAIEAVTRRVVDARADGESVPKPRSAETYCSVPLVLDAGLPGVIDEAVGRRGLTRSASPRVQHGSRSHNRLSGNAYTERYWTIKLMIASATSVAG
jgi:hypothetical protein